MKNEEQVGKIIEDIFDNYCRFPEVYLQRYHDVDDAATNLVEEMCCKCPLENLRDAIKQTRGGDER